MTKTLLIVSTVCVALFSSGCATFMNDRTAQDARTQTEIRNLRSEIARLKERVSAMETVQQDLYGETASLRLDVQEARRESSEAGSEIAACEKRTEARLTRMQSELVESLSAKIAALMKRGGGGAGRRTETGYEHVVQPGETLSEIASAYNVAVDVIVRANNLSNPNSIRVGQTLFIPE